MGKFFLHGKLKLIARDSHFAPLALRAHRKSTPSSATAAVELHPFTRASTSLLNARNPYKHVYSQPQGFPSRRRPALSADLGLGSAGFPLQAVEEGCQRGYQDLEPCLLRSCCTCLCCVRTRTFPTSSFPPSLLLVVLAVSPVPSSLAPSPPTRLLSSGLRSRPSKTPSSACWCKKLRRNWISGVLRRFMDIRIDI
ncbi:hypothetical protein G7K_4504-t1 [Saitoella complicata NRRL Y-17804]|uniref:Uncharacterized protein n=1 Tax=Saitoella complicata (strain BCRC 22490 / CBS 7301 / JCM 7358 / NBRC 10748 / NRRL Y-17804) TaxID=698492 RepID=A0A0E9NKJ1_SAICN|nr:hypothetical protein G7K_4504-t1 [Saitoella complicata NRRL Y-17804]